LGGGPGGIHHCCWHRRQGRPSRRSGTSASRIFPVPTDPPRDELTSGRQGRRPWPEETPRPGVPSGRPHAPDTDLKKLCRSGLMMSALTVHIPCDRPGYTFSVAFLSSLIVSSAESAMGTIWSSSPCITRVGTSIFFRSGPVTLSRVEMRRVGALVRRAQYRFASPRLGAAAELAYRYPHRET